MLIASPTPSAPDFGHEGLRRRALEAARAWLVQLARRGLPPRHGLDQARRRIRASLVELLGCRGAEVRVVHVVDLLRLGALRLSQGGVRIRRRRPPLRLVDNGCAPRQPPHGNWRRPDRRGIALGDLFRAASMAAPVGGRTRTFQAQCRRAAADAHVRGGIVHRHTGAGAPRPWRRGLPANAAG